MMHDDYSFTKIWNLKILFAKRAGYQISLLFKFTMFLQCQVSLPFSIYKVFTEPNQCLDLHDVYDDKYLLDIAASLKLLFTRYLHVPKRKAPYKEDTLNTCKTFYTFLHGLQSITAEGR